MSRVNLRQLLSDAYTVERNDYEDKEVKKHGVLRAGNSGLVDAAGHSYVSCPRQAYLRSAGIEIEPPTKDRLVMFDGGILNEDRWYNKLSKTWNGTILREEEIPITWTTKGGRKVAGRPDLVLCTDEGKPVHGLELKKISSIWTARDVVFEKKPKMSHLVQAAHYMWQLNITMDLCYTQYDDFPSPVYKWALSSFPSQGEPGSEYCEYNNQGNLKKVLPSDQIYNLNFMDGQLYYKHESESSYRTTIITVDAIKRYYERVADMFDNGTLAEPPSNIDLNGDPVKWNICDYCPLQTDRCIGSKSMKDWLEYINDFTRNKRS